jgi:hypothetical protein
MDSKKYGVVWILFYTFLLTLSGQTPPDDLHGADLRSWIKSNYYDGKHTDLGYNGARKKMFAYIDNKNDSVECVYSGYKYPNAYGNEVTYLGSGVIVNTEHSIPQSWFGKASPMRSDIFHLFPTYAKWNSARGSLPFDEIEDDDVDKWFIYDLEYTSTPYGNLENYSRLNTNTSFEPRDVHKGNLARAAFYFYTMYPDKAGDITRLGDLDMFYSWNIADPVDAAELARNDAIETYQGNRNPYIDHPEWIARAWDIATGMEDAEALPETAVLAKVYPNPFNPQTVIKIEALPGKELEVKAYSISGKLVDEIYSGTANVRDIKLSWQPYHLSSGQYFIVVRSGNLTRVVKAQYVK